MALKVNTIENTGPIRIGARSSDGGVGLAEITDTLMRRWPIVLVTTLVVLGAAVLFILFSPSLYTASTQVLIDPRDRRILGTEVMAASTGADPTLVESQLRIISSDAVLGRVVSALKLDADPEFVPASRESAAVRTTRAIIALRRKVTVSRPERTYVIDVAATARSPERAKAIADAVAAFYLEDQSDATRLMTRRATEALTSRLSQLRVGLRAAENKALAFRKAHGIVMTQGALVSEQQLGDINRRLVQARVHSEDAQARYQTLRGSIGSGGSSELLGSGVLTALKAQLAEVTRREAELSVTLGDRHPALVEVRAQLRNTRRLIGAETSRISQSAAGELTVARQNERAIVREFSQLTGQTQSDNVALIELRDLEREVEAGRKLYEAFLTRAKQTAEQEQIAMTGARILAPAAFPLSASYPPAFLVLLIALVVGLGLGATLALINERAFQREA